MPGRNHNRYYYLLLTLFEHWFSALLTGLRITLTIWLYSLKYERSKTEFTLWWIMHLHPINHQDPCAYNPLDHLELRLDPYPYIVTARYCDVTLPPRRPGRSWCRCPQSQASPCLKRCWSASSLCEPTIKANCFGSHATHGTSVPERASADVEPSRYEGDEVVATMRRYEEELIAVARKMTCNPWSAGPVIMTLQLPSLLDVSSVERIGVGMSVTW